MTHIPTSEQIFQSNFSTNVRILNSAKININREINRFLRKGDESSVQIYTNLYLLIYSSWAEASLVKLVHTPFGFSLDEKKDIFKDRDVLNRWKKCVNIAFSKYRKQGSEIPNKKKKIHRMLDDYLKAQGNIRNKIAHGQWNYTLHKNNITFDENAQALVACIDVMQIETWFEILKQIIDIVLGLVDSREHNDNRAHYDFYFEKLSNVQSIIEERRKWTLEDKVSRLKLKPITFNNNSA